MNAINAIIRFSLKNRLLVILGALAILVGGIYSYENMDIDVFPDLTAPTVVVMSDCQGMSAEEVERLVTFPIEQVVNGATDVRRVRSSSQSGYSFVWIEFDWGVDVLRARQIVNEKMTTIDNLPEGINPILAPQSSVMGEILFVGLSSDSVSMMDLRTMADWQIKPAILSAGGVANVSVLGGDVKQYHITIEPTLMASYGVSIQEIENTIRNFSSNSSAGVIREYGNEYTIQGIARTDKVEDLQKSFIKQYEGRKILLQDVARVEIKPEVKYGEASLNNKKAVILSISKQPNTNTLKVTRNIEKSLESIQKSLPKNVKIDSQVFRQADFIESSIGNVGKALLEGAIFVIIVLFIFLNSARTTIISVIAIPISLLFTMIVLLILGMDINTMTLGGMCIAIGSLVDDAIIDVENVYKRLKENHLKDKQEIESSIKIVYEASKEIRSSVMSATFIIMVAFVPLFFLSGMEGRLLKPLGITYIISLFASLIVAMTLTPLLCNTLLSSEKYLMKNEKTPKLTLKLHSVYERMLQWVMNNKKKVITSTLVLLVGAVVLVFCMGRSFLPDFNEGSMTITAVVKPGTSLEVSNKVGSMIEKKLLSIDGVTSTARRTGRGDLDEHSQSVNSCEIDVKFDLKGKSKEEIFDQVRDSLNSIPGVASTIGQPISHRIDHMISGTKANIAIKLFGTDLQQMITLGNQIQNTISDIDGLVDVSVEQQSFIPQLQIRADRDKLAMYGISIEEFNRFVELAFASQKVGEIYEGQTSVDVVMSVSEDYSPNIEDIQNALIDTHDGNKVPLGYVAEIVSNLGPSVIGRENGQRKLVVQANVSGRDVTSAVKEIQEEIEEKIHLPQGYSIQYGGQFESAKNATRTLILATLISLLVIFVLLYMEFKDVSLAGIVLCSLPLSMIGGVIAVAISSQDISIPALIGFITLFGIATRNGVLLISRYQKLYSEGLSLNQTIIQGSLDRLTPIIMTALTSALALIPMIIAGDKTGNEIQAPMAIVVLGGLLTSTILNIFIMPILFEWKTLKKQQNKR